MVEKLDQKEKGYRQKPSLQKKMYFCFGIIFIKRKEKRLITKTAASPPEGLPDDF